MKKISILLILISLILSCVETPEKEDSGPEETLVKEEISLLGYGLVKASNKAAGEIMAQNYAYILLGAQIDGISFEYQNDDNKQVTIKQDSSFQGARVYETRQITMDGESYVMTIVGVELEVQYLPRKFKTQKVEILLNTAKAAQPQNVLLEALSQLAYREKWSQKVSGKAFLTDLSIEEKESEFVLKATVFFKIS
ncbi:MAG: hypothetical protein JXR70_17590 [Spirochaetales bacterium]|nr:hypothetical protein [Spirochaetales bacterium]